MHGYTERHVEIVEETNKRIKIDFPAIKPELCMHLACSAHNDIDRISGFAPTQWVYGRDPLDSMSKTQVASNATADSSRHPWWQAQRYRLQAEEH